MNALNAARQSLDADLLMSLTRATFPAEMHFGAGPQAIPDQLIRDLLQLDVTYVQAKNAEEKNQVCGVISFMLPVLAQFERRLPEQAPLIRQAVNRCQSLSPLSQQLIDDTLGEPKNTVEDLLKAAEDSDDLKVRTVYKNRAVGLAREKKQLDRAIAILDDMSKDEREFMGTIWEYYRWDLASLSAIDHYIQGDLNGMRVTLNAVPNELRVVALIAFIDRLGEKRNKETDPTLEFLTEARKQLDSAAAVDDKKYPLYFVLLRLTVQYAPAEAMEVLKKAIATLNRAEQNQREQTSSQDSEFVKNVPVSLIEMDEFAVKAAVSSITSRQTRTQLRLALLAASLQRMRMAKRTMPSK
jgi:hypothetical protein